MSQQMGEVPKSFASERDEEISHSALLPRRLFRHARYRSSLFLQTGDQEQSMLPD
jgi:hypothetical protein